MLNEARRNLLQELVASLQLKGAPDYNLINQALTHPSYLHEGSAQEEGHNQRLEFLGDAVLGLVIAQYLFQKYPHRGEGELTKMRAAIVCEASLCQAAQKINLGKYLLLGKGEELMGGAQRSSNLADGFEALMGALYLSLGLEKVSSFIIRVLKEKIRIAVQGNIADYKTQLQEHIQQEPKNKLVYRIIQEEGPDHHKYFQVAVYLNEEMIARGGGHTKKEAEQAAARLALQELGVI